GEDEGRGCAVEDAAEEVGAARLAGVGEGASVAEDDFGEDAREEAPLRDFLRDDLRYGLGGGGLLLVEREDLGCACVGLRGLRRGGWSGDELVDHCGADSSEVEAAEVGVGVEVAGAGKLDEVGGDVVAE